MCRELQLLTGFGKTFKSPNLVGFDFPKVEIALLGPPPSVGKIGSTIHSSQYSPVMM